MSSRRLFLTCTCVSVLLHLLVLWLVYRFPSTVRRPEEVMEIDLSDIPRSTDFLPPEAGILEGRPPHPVRPAPKPARNARRELPAPRVPEGRVPDLPVRPDLPPEKSFPPPRPEEAPPREATGPSAPEAKQAGAGAAKPEPVPPEPSKSVRDLIPPLGKMVLAAKEPAGGRGQGAAGGNAVGTGGAATGKEGVTEEGGSGGFHLTPLNAPEIQYISYYASIKRKIENVWNYPYEAATAGIQGELTIVFVIARSGKVDSIELIRGSGSKILDDEAIRAIRKAAPFDPIPAQYKIPSLLIQGRFVYSHGGALFR